MHLFTATATIGMGDTEVSCLQRGTTIPNKPIATGILCTVLQYSGLVPKTQLEQLGKCPFFFLIKVIHLSTLTLQNKYKYITSLHYSCNKRVKYLLINHAPPILSSSTPLAPLINIYTHIISRYIIN